MLPQEKVKQLIDLMNTISSVVIPAQKPVYELFDLAMDEKMVDYLIAVGNQPKSLSQLEEIYYELFGKDEAAWKSHWELVNLRGFIHVESNERRDLYSLTPIFPGWIEFFTLGPENETRQAVVEKFMEFYDLMKTMNKFPFRHIKDFKTMQYPKKGIAPRFTVYPTHGSQKEIILDQELTSKQEVYTAHSLHKLLERHKDELAIGNCLCRLHKKYSKGEDCENGIPLQSCMMIGAVGKNLIENGSARHLSYEEAIELLDIFEKKGAVHTAFHYKNDANLDEFAICNCCTDCCINYGGYQKGYLSNIYTRTFYKPEIIDLNRCVGCNLCGKYCPTEATYYDKDKKKLMFDYKKCIGCGQCVTQCKFDVRKMVEDGRDVFVKSKSKNFKED